MGQKEDDCGSPADSPPPYTPYPVHSPAPGENRGSISQSDIAAAFSALNLTNKAPETPSPDTCLAHLKLLYAFRALREDVGYTDGLWGIRDPAAGPEVTQQAMSRLRERRWAIYLARAVDRYEAWWKSLEGTELTTADMTTPGSTAYELFTQGGAESAMAWDEKMLIPLDVLMVWHTHMLNPRAYLEDCIRAGRRALWLGGLPWATINDAIDNTSFTYSVPEPTKTRWEKATGLQWDNTDCPMTRQVTCPSCSTASEVPWTTSPTDMESAGHGYGDGDFRTTCPHCAHRITMEGLCAAKFVNDARNLLERKVPMAGAVLSLSTGTPVVLKPDEGYYSFPNHLLLRKTHDKLLRIFESRDTVTMGDVRKAVEGMLQDLEPMEDLLDVVKGQGDKYFLMMNARMAVRKMLSRYNSNSSALALDLGPAVLRQALFIDKMFKLDWLHSPAATSTMTRLITKYTRFVDMMARYPKDMAVPTLDVDLAWHTAQLSPASYLRHTVDVTGKFVDHDDKVADVVLKDAFEIISKRYQKLYSEVYSECTCWYCETTRISHAPSISAAFGLSTQGKIADEFHASGAARSCPPDNSAHMSAHNSVASAVSSREKERRQAILDEEFEKARARAQKKGRSIESSKEYHDHWGHRYFMYGPWAPAPVYYPPLYPGGCPTAVGSAGCAQKTCAAGVANGVCGGPGGCGNCGTDGVGGMAGGCAMGACSVGKGGCGGGCAGVCGGGSIGI